MGRRPAFALSGPALVGAYTVLGGWALVVLFPLYWIVVTSFKEPVHVYAGPTYLPFVDFQPSLHAWRYIFVDLRNDTLRPFLNTVVVASTSAVLSLALGMVAGYALLRFRYRPRLATIGAFLGCVGLGALAVALGARWEVAAAGALGAFALSRGALPGRWTLTNDDIAFWMISQRILPPVAVVIPIYVMFQQVGLLDTHLALVATYTTVNLPIVVWLMRDYFRTLPQELEESAQLDGAGPYRIFRSIVLPLAAPGIAATFLLVLVFCWNEYLLALFLTGASAQTLPLSIAAQNATRGPQWWYMSVLILLMITPVIAIALALERYIARGLLVGAIRG